MNPDLTKHILAAMTEDIGPGDLTSEYFIPAESISVGRIMAKEEGVCCGGEIAAVVFQMLDRKLDLALLKKDGDPLHKGDVIMEIRGKTRSILTGERVALNYLQRLCGVATQTRRYVEAVKPHPVKILDTRKTTPGWRLLEKGAVAVGGGQNHRLGLYDMVMVKDNHIAAQGSLEKLQQAIDKFKRRHPAIKVEVEAAKLSQVEDFLKMEGIDIILLDNMSPAQIREAVEMNQGRVKLEASGGITLETLADYAATGVDFISVGALTHSAKALDISLELEDS